jgi:chorismate mutase / prephenate dehydratase
MVKRVAVLGPKGTNGHEAGSRFMIGEEASEFIFCQENVEVFSKILSGEADYGVIPIHNSSTGLIDDVKRFWLGRGDDFEKRGVYPIMETSLSIRHCLLVRPDFPVDAKIKRVFSHPEALKQCRARGITDEQAALSTADAAQLVSLSDPESGIAAIASRFAAEAYGLKILQEDVQDNGSNETTFHLIGRKKSLATSGCKTAIIFWLDNEPGSLDGVLGVISAARRNKSMLATVFTGDKGKIAFYVEFDGHKDEKVVEHVLGLIKCITNKLVVLGSFLELLSA